MRERLRKAALTWACGALALGGCDSADFFVPETVAALAACSADGVADLSSVVEGLLLLVEAAQDPMNPPPGVTFTPTTGSNGTFTVDLDFDGDLVPDRTANGTLTTADDLTDGFEVGESFTVDWSLGPALAGAMSPGSGSFLFARSSLTEVDLGGGGELATADGCLFTYANTAVTVDIGDPEDLQASGTVDFTVEDGAEQMVGTVLFLPGDIVEVEAQVDGARFDFLVDLETGNVTFV